MLPSPRRSNSRFLVSRGSLLGLLALTAYLAFVSIALAVAPPVNTVAPSVSGDAEVGSTLSATTGTWTGDPAPTYAYQWQRCEQTTPLVTTPFNTSNLGGQTYVDPRDITIDSSGNLYVTNTFTGSVSKVAPDGTTNGTWGTAIAGSQPFAIDVDPSGNVYVANRGNGTVRKIPSGGGAGSTLFSLTTAQAVTVDSSGNVYAGNSDGTIVKYDSGGNLVWSKSAGAAINDVVTDSSGNLYALKNSGIAKVAADGTLTASWATTGGQPQEFAIDSSGNLYTANYSSNNITKTTPAGGAYTVFGTTGTNPRDVVVDNTTGSVYVINAGANTTTKINAAGQSTTPYSTTGLFPLGITRNSSGDLYTVNYSSSNVTGVGPDLSCNDISGADDPTYTLTGDDKDKKIRVKVTGTNGSGSSDSASAPTSLVTAPPVNTVAPSVSGDTEVGSTLSATTGTWTGDPTITYGYQWQRCDADGTNCVDISGADGLSYEVTSGDIGKTIKFKVTGTNTEGSADATSDPTEVVPTPPSPPTPSKPSVKPPGRAGANSMRLNIRCAGSSACTVKITGKLKGGKGTVEPKTIKVKAGKKATVKVAYTPTLTSELKRKGGGRIVLKAKQVGGATRTLTVKVALPKPVTG